jgi:hypothetical protein
VRSERQGQGIEYISLVYVKYAKERSRTVGEDDRETRAWEPFRRKRQDTPSDARMNTGELKRVEEVGGYEQELSSYRQVSVRQWLVLVQDVRDVERA